MKTLPTQRPGRQEKSTKPLDLGEARRLAEGLHVEACTRCRAPIFWSRGEEGRRAIEVLADESGHVGIETSLLKLAETGSPAALQTAAEFPTAYHTSLRTRFTWHADRCFPSFTGQARPRKGRP